MMKFKCINCNETYIKERPGCPACGHKEAYIREPAIKQIGDLDLHLSDLVEHIESKNRYQIQEFQKNGMVTTFFSGPLHNNANGKQRCYISNSSILEYKKC